MRTITVTESISLDGVMQAPATPDEDTRGAFTRGGWATASVDQVVVEYMTRGAEGGTGGCLLLGGRTYEGLLAHVKVTRWRGNWTAEL